MAKYLKATHEGPLKINDVEIQAYNLENGERVMSRATFIRALGRTGKAKGGRKYDQDLQVPVFLTASNLKPYISQELLESSTPIPFLDLNGKKSIGYKASLLAEVCYVFIDALEGEALKTNQLHIAQRAKILVRGFATVGLIALVDEATGYQYDRNRQELQKILKAYVSEHLLKWEKRFPDEFYVQMFRLRGWKYTTESIKRRPGVIGTWTNKLIYEQLPEGVLQKLKSETPKTKKGNRKHKFHQLLTTEIGNPHLEKQINSVVTLMKVSSTWKGFERLFKRAFPKGQQKEIDFGDID